MFRRKAMLRVWSFALAVALCCTFGLSSAHANYKAKILKALGQSLASGYQVKNGKLYLYAPIRFDLPRGGSFEAGEFDLWKPTLGGACAVWENCRKLFFGEKMLGTGDQKNAD